MKVTIPAGIRLIPIDKENDTLILTKVFPIPSTPFVFRKGSILSLMVF